MKTKVIAKINEVSILVVLDQSKPVPIKPICEALGIDYPTQYQKIKDDPILGSTVGLNPIVAKDGKEREMVCLPLKFTFGWLFTINPENVKPEAKEVVIKYKLECYDALYKHFVEYKEFVEEKQKQIEEKLVLMTSVRTEFKTAKLKLEEANKQLDKVRKFTFEDWQVEKGQIKIEFIEPIAIE